VVLDRRGDVAGDDILGIVKQGERDDTLSRHVVAEDRVADGAQGVG